MKLEQFDNIIMWTFVLIVGAAVVLFVAHLCGEMQYM